MRHNVAAALLLTLAAGTCVTFASETVASRSTAREEVPEAPVNVAESPRVEVVFVLDTTGSMSNLIEGAKRKIWAIANVIAGAKPTPQIRMGLVGYRDRGDEYVTRLTPLTEDLDTVYADLMRFSADGGGDGPESVNQALHEAVTRFDWSDDDASTLKLIYLVGDAPPHMDYEQDVSYSRSCVKAATAGIIVNTIQCGSMRGTEPVWREIARSAEGEYFRIAQSGGMTAVSTPFDDDLSRLSSEMDRTFLIYGDREAQKLQARKLALSGEIAEAAPAEAVADRAAFRASKAGGFAFAGDQELLHDLEAGKVELNEIDAGELPAEMQTMTPAERDKYVAAKSAERKRIQAEIQELGRKRLEWMKQHAADAPADGFDQRVVEVMRRQGESKGIAFEEK